MNLFHRIEVDAYDNECPVIDKVGFCYRVYLVNLYHYPQHLVAGISTCCHYNSVHI